MARSTYFSSSARIRRFLEHYIEDVRPSAARLVSELFAGMLAGGSSLLSEIARRIEDETTLPHREKRLSRALGRPGWWQDAVRGCLLHHGAGQVRRDDLIAVDISDLAKPYARRLQYLDLVHDGSRKTIVPGYWLYEAWHIGRDGQPLPLQLFAYSTREPEFVSENREWLNGLWPLMRALGGKGILLVDRGADRWKLMKELLEYPQRWIIRQRGDRHLVGPDGVKKRAVEWARELLGTGNRAGVMRVCLPKSRVPLWLVASPPRKGQRKPFMLLCRVSWQMNMAARALRAYRARWRAEDAIRATKQGLGLEKFLVRSMRRIDRLMAIALLVMRFVAELIFRGNKLVRHLIRRDARFQRQVKVYLSPVLTAVRRLLVPMAGWRWKPG